MARPITRINYSRVFTAKPCVLSAVKPGMIIDFGYKGLKVNDKTPLIYVLEVRKDRVYGLNLRYKPTAYTDIIRIKQRAIEETLKRNFDSFSKKYNIPAEKLEVHKQKIRATMLQDLNTMFLQVFGHNLTASQTKHLLRNYLTPGISSPKYLVYNPK